MEATILRDTTNEFSRIYYTFGTIGAWRNVWNALCEMGYNPQATQYSSIVVRSETSDKDDANAYGFYTVSNQHLICLNESWREYDRKTPIINRELKYLYVPRVLFECLGVRNWFRHSFPECEVEYWS